MQNILFKIRILNPSFENKRSYVVKCDFIEGFSNIVSDKQNVFFWWTETFKLQSLIMLRMSAVVVASIKPLHLFHATSSLLMLKAKKGLSFLDAHWYKPNVFIYNYQQKLVFGITVSSCFSRQGVWSQEQNVTKGTFWGHHTHSSSHTASEAVEAVCPWQSPISCSIRTNFLSKNKRR